MSQTTFPHPFTKYWFISICKCFLMPTLHASHVTFAQFICLFANIPHLAHTPCMSWGSWLCQKHLVHVVYQVQPTHFVTPASAGTTLLQVQWGNRSNMRYQKTSHHIGLMGWPPDSKRMVVYPKLQRPHSLWHTCVDWPLWTSKLFMKQFLPSIRVWFEFFPWLQVKLSQSKYCLYGLYLGSRMKESV